MRCYAMRCYAMLCYAVLCYAMLCYAMLCVLYCAMLWNAVPCYAVLCDVVLLYATLFPSCSMPPVLLFSSPRDSVPRRHTSHPLPLSMSPSQHPCPTSPSSFFFCPTVVTLPSSPSCFVSPFLLCCVGESREGEERERGGGGGERRRAATE